MRKTAAIALFGLSALGISRIAQWTEPRRITDTYPIADMHTASTMPHRYTGDDNVLVLIYDFYNDSADADGAVGYRKCGAGRELYPLAKPFFILDRKKKKLIVDLNMDGYADAVYAGKRLSAKTIEDFVPSCPPETTRPQPSARTMAS